ncbi:L,D-transpeptidase/peptidoglycan binding protein [Clostridiaceae bacterium UIB06]|uniref:L,D-transpeptidase/peptidoglycan binding protein n=1 Tax=Clostridium thailandense TaxID=2794346 RepID=A0A949TMJ8_9CLOT|nr:peptidoglycan binding domain-containing protein [Clostridium thailandense]MBV7273212.1 L,D-transpeptidase/peptidoglycan binding protein [Clostridium thailandense]MCH5136069.1 L,D-transpeptidase/peptidoglycan binding protein [Clostridiaceae bacterium UIB06]
MGITEKDKRNKITKGIIIFLCTVLILYLTIAAHFMKHFFLGSEINGINVSDETIAEAKEKMTSELQKYTLSLKERDGKSEQIRGSEIGLRYNSKGEYNSFKDKQNPFKWGRAVFNSGAFKMTDGLSYNTELLKKSVDKLLCLQTNNIVEPKNPNFKYTDKGYIIVNEVNGNKINKEVLYNYIKKAILEGETTVDLETINCYVKPKYTSKSSKVIEVKNILNKYVSSRITYVFGDRKETIDNSIINKWLEVNKNIEITFNYRKMKDYMDELFNNYNTAGKTRNFATSSGKTISIGGGDYGWIINTDKEIQDLDAAIKEGQTIIKEPTYMQKALSRNINDIGNTYVEIDMTNQHLWFYKNNSLIAEGDIVTGNVSSNHSTPQGIYSLKYKQRNTVLRGPGYNSPVDFWMPFNGGIGLHDASWRSEFGNNIYRTNGSHGCVNLPYYLAKTIFNNIEEGDPVVCYY